MSDRLIDRDQRPEDQLDTHLRPQLLKEFVGQSKAKQNLHVFIEAANRFVRGQINDFEFVDVCKFRSLGQRGAGHAGELLVEAEIVLERDRSQRLRAARMPARTSPLAARPSGPRCARAARRGRSAYAPHRSMRTG